MRQLARLLVLTSVSVLALAVLAACQTCCPPPCGGPVVAVPKSDGFGGKPAGPPTFYRFKLTSEVSGEPSAATVTYMDDQAGTHAVHSAPLSASDCAGAYDCVNPNPGTCHAFQYLRIWVLKVDLTIGGKPYTSTIQYSDANGNMKYLRHACSDLQFNAGQQKYYLVTQLTYHQPLVGGTGYFDAGPVPITSEVIAVPPPPPPPTPPRPDQAK